MYKAKSVQHNVLVIKFTTHKLSHKKILVQYVPSVSINPLVCVNIKT